MSVKDKKLRDYIKEHYYIEEHDGDFMVAIPLLHLVDLVHGETARHLAAAKQRIQAVAADPQAIGMVNRTTALSMIDHEIQSLDKTEKEES